MTCKHFLNTMIVICLCWSYVQADTNNTDQSLNGTQQKDIRTDHSLKKAEVDKIKTKKNNVLKVEIFGKGGCTYCKKALAYFDRNNISYKYFDIEKDKSAMERVKKLTPYVVVPIVIINDEVIEGYSPESYDDYVK